MGDFTEAETRALVAQHTEESGQPFSAAALEAVWTQTRGQPWLVNALCAGACFDNKAGRDRSRTIEADDVYAAREELILSRRTHLDQLAHKLEEERVRRVVEPILSGGEVRHDGRDLEYVRDLGLLAPDSPPRIANPIYAEVVPHHHAAARTKATRTPSGAGTPAHKGGRLSAIGTPPLHDIQGFTRTGQLQVPVSPPPPPRGGRPISGIVAVQDLIIAAKGGAAARPGGPGPLPWW